jgi:two-component system, chemotaxis family, sensor kinase CheA
MSERARREFVAEASELLEAMPRAFAHLAEATNPEPARLNELFRAAHSLKGLCAMMAADSITEVAHELESVFDALRLGKISVGLELLVGFDQVMQLFHAQLLAVKGGAAPPPASPELLTLLRNCYATTSTPPSMANATTVSINDLALPPGVHSSFTQFEEHRVLESLRQGIPMYVVHAPLPLSSFEVQLSGLTARLSQRGEVITTLPTAGGGSNEIIFDIVFASTMPMADIDVLVAGVAKHVTRVDRSEGGRHRSMLPEESPTLRQLGDTVRVDIRKLDELMGIVAELFLARSGLQQVMTQLTTSAGGVGVPLVQRVSRMLERRLDELQLAIMQVRMVPLGQVFDRLVVSAKRVAMLVDKNVRFELRGEETELDKLLVEELVDPLMHLVRNAIDHGLEDAATRVKAGKPATGQVALRAFPRGNQVVIEISDDGRGIDEVAVKRAALERGLVAEDHIGAMSQAEVWNLLFLPGLSTRTSISQTSGRGVGLDVVKTNIARLSGMIEIASATGVGTTFTITLPITLAVVPATIIGCAGIRYALPLASVQEVVAIEHVDWASIEGREVLRLRGATLPVLRLARALHLQEPTRPKSGHAAVVGVANQRVALFFDDIAGQQDIVIKPLGAFLTRIRHIAGATQVGEQETVLVLDVGTLMEDTMEPTHPRTGVHSEVRA